MRNLRELKGPPIASRMLERLVAGPLPPLLIFCGPDGTGKVSAAEALIQQRLCETGNGCGSCAACRKILREDHSDVIVFPDGKVPIGDPDNPEPFTVRWLLRKRIQYAPFDGPERLVLFPRAEGLMDEAETALLKTLEEPPEHTRFILVSRSIDALKPTIVSRGLVVPFSPLSHATLRGMTKDSDDVLDLAAGSLESLGLLHSEFFNEARQRITEAQRHPQGLLDLEAWLRAGEKQAFGDLNEGNFSYTELLDFVTLLLLRFTDEHPQRAVVRRAIFAFKGDLHQELSGLTPYLLSRLFAALAEAFFDKDVPMPTVHLGRK